MRNGNMASVAQITLAGLAALCNGRHMLRLEMCNGDILTGTAEGTCPDCRGLRFVGWVHYPDQTGHPTEGCVPWREVRDWAIVDLPSVP